MKNKQKRAIIHQNMEKLPKIKERLKNRTKTVEYDGGTIEYVILGRNNEDHNPVAIVPGFTEGLIALHNFGKYLAEDGERQVLVTEQPEVGHKLKIDAVDHQAEAWLATIEANGWQNRSVDVVAHSFGSIVFDRAAMLAYLRGWKCFDSQLGSKTVFVAPSGTNPDESLISMTPRYLKLMKTIVAGKEKADSKTAENGKEILDQGLKSTLKQPRKYAKEIAPILGDRVKYSRLGAVGVKPHVIAYNSDQLYSHRIIGPTLLENLEHTDGYSMPVDKEATHNHLLYNNLTAKAVLQILDGQINGVPINQ